MTKEKKVSDLSITDIKAAMFDIEQRSKQDQQQWNLLNQALVKELEKEKKDETRTMEKDSKKSA